MPTRLAIVAAVIAVVAVALFAGTAVATDRPGFCPSCHEMRPYYEAWRASPHSDVWCIDCHVEAGIPARFAHKFVALGEVRSHIVGDTTFPRPAPPEVPNERCLRCHDDLPATIDGFPHAEHAEKGACAECHYDTGHDVTEQALRDAGIFAEGVTVQRLTGVVAAVDGGSANLTGHKEVTCTRCHDMKATGCDACHEAKHERAMTGPCTDCHRPGESFEFVHPARRSDCESCHKAPRDDHPAVGAKKCAECHAAGAQEWDFKHPGLRADCTSCHKRPAGHASGACTNCHRKPGDTWAFAHPGVGEEHSWRSFACTKCHPVSFDRATCTCHKNGIPND